jgi:hypothetical protein
VPAAAAARNLTYDAVDWLLELGTDVHANGVGVLLAAIASLDETMVDTVREAGTHLRVDSGLGGLTALTQSRGTCNRWRPVSPAGTSI